MNGKAVTFVNSCHHAANTAFQYKTENSIWWRFQLALEPQGIPFVGANITEKVDSKISISWAGETNKSFMKRIGSITVGAKRMLICFTTRSNGTTGLEGCSHFGGWLLELIQSINFAALLQAGLVPSDLKLSMHLFYQNIFSCVCVCVCVCVCDCLINDLFSILICRKVYCLKCVSIYTFFWLKKPAFGYSEI